MDIAQLREHFTGLQDTLSAKIQQQREYLKASGRAPGLCEQQGRRGCSSRDAGAEGREAPARAAEVPESKHKRLKWSGRGLMPVWMREEMKGANSPRKIS